MTDTRALPTSSPEVRAYVARVRAALSDLSADEVDELTQGMEADLEELAAESGSVRARLGAPEAYAAELRLAAGLAARRAASSSRPFEAQLDRLRRRRDDLVARPWVRELRPVGWVLRGVVAAWCALAVVGAQHRGNALLWALGAAASFWVGRRTLDWRGSRRRALTALNVAAALVGVFAALPQVLAAPTEDVRYVEVGPSPMGLVNDGEPVTGLTVYDSTGRQVDRPRVLDQNGNPVLPVLDDAVFTPPATMAPLPQPATSPSDPSPSPLPDASTPTGPGASSSARPPATSPSAPSSTALPTPSR